MKRVVGGAFETIKARRRQSRGLEVEEGSSPRLVVKSKHHAKRVADALPKARARRCSDKVVKAKFIVTKVYRAAAEFVNPASRVSGRIHLNFRGTLVRF